EYMDMQVYRSAAGRLSIIDAGHVADWLGQPSRLAEPDEYHGYAATLRMVTLMEAPVELGRRYLEDLRKNDPVAFAGVVDYVLHSMGTMSSFKQLAPKYGALITTPPSARAGTPFGRVRERAVGDDGLFSGTRRANRNSKNIIRYDPRFGSRGAAAILQGIVTPAVGQSSDELEKAIDLAHTKKTMGEKIAILQRAGINDYKVREKLFLGEFVGGADDSVVKQLDDARKLIAGDDLNALRALRKTLPGLARAAGADRAELKRFLDDWADIQAPPLTILGSGAATAASDGDYRRVPLAQALGELAPIWPDEAPYLASVASRLLDLGRGDVTRDRYVHQF